MLPRYVMTGDFGVRVNMPSMSYTHTSADYKVKIQTNNKGMRSIQDAEYANPDSKFRVMILGDSFAMGYGVNFDETFTEKLKNSLEQEFSITVEIINLAVSGYSTAEQLLMYENEGKKYSPNVVISTWHKSDLEENLRSNLFQLNESGLSRKNKTYLPGMKQREFLFSLPGFQFIAQNSQFYNFVRERAARFVKQVLLKESIEENDLKTQNDPLKGSLDISLALLTELERLVGENDSKLLLLNIPEKVKRGEYLDSLPNLLRRNFENQIIDVKDQITEASKDHLIYWERAQGHFTPKGTTIVAEETYRFIVEKGIVKSGKSS